MFWTAAAGAIVEECISSFSASAMDFMLDGSESRVHCIMLYGI